jgi:hypothetical protein
MNGAVKIPTNPMTVRGRMPSSLMPGAIMQAKSTIHMMRMMVRMAFSGPPPFFLDGALIASSLRTFPLTMK